MGIIVFGVCIGVPSFWEAKLGDADGQGLGLARCVALTVSWGWVGMWSSW